MITDHDAIMVFEIIIRAAPALLLLGGMALAKQIWGD